MSLLYYYLLVFQIQEWPSKRVKEEIFKECLWIWLWKNVNHVWIKWFRLNLRQNAGFVEFAAFHLYEKMQPLIILKGTIFESSHILVSTVNLSLRVQVKDVPIFIQTTVNRTKWPNFSQIDIKKVICWNKTIGICIWNPTAISSRHVFRSSIGRSISPNILAIFSSIELRPFKY